MDAGTVLLGIFGALCGSTVALFFITHRKQEKDVPWWMEEDISALKTMVALHAGTIRDLQDRMDKLGPAVTELERKEQWHGLQKDLLDKRVCALEGKEKHE